MVTEMSKRILSARRLLRKLHLDQDQDHDYEEDDDKEDYINESDDTIRFIREVNKMETKSRYEVIAELEKQKRDLILERDNMPDVISKKQEIIQEKRDELDDFNRESDRDIKKMQKELSDYEKRQSERKETVKELIRSIDASLERFNNMSQNTARQKNQ